jgi:phosphopantothenate---cysteine ligase (ATP)
VFVSPGSQDRWIRMPFRQNRGESNVPEVETDEPIDPKSLPDGEPEIEIESHIIPAVQDLHTKYIQTVEEKERA